MPDIYHIHATYEEDGAKDDGGDDDGDVDYDLLGENLMAYDHVGRGRTPAHWWTLNCGWRGYNSVYDIHRLNVSSSLAREVCGPIVTMLLTCGSISCALRQTWRHL